jgi:hypothetical protein
MKNEETKADEEMKDEEPKPIDPFKMEMLSCFYNFVSVFQQPDSVSDKLMLNNLNQSILFMHETFRDKTNLEDTWHNCIVHANLVILGLISDLGLYYNHDSVPMMLFMSLGKFGNVADSANS